MAVTESSLLTSFLIPPAPLAVSLSLDQFTELFPKARRDDPVIPALYRELQKQRSQDVDRVKQNIAAESKLGSRQQQHIRKIRLARLQQQDKSDEAEMSMEAKLFPENVANEQRQAHTAETLIPEMEQAAQDMEQEIAELQNEAQDILRELRTSVGDLSDLRYGRFSKTPGENDSDLATEVLQSLSRIQQLSEGTRKG